MAVFDNACSFDLETTGIDVTQDRIVTAACLDINMTSGQRTLFNWLANPGIEIPEGAVSVHGITTDYARAHGEDHDKVLYEVIEHIYSAWRAGAVLIVYNAAYDLSMLHVLSNGDFNIRGPVIDPFVIDKGVDRYRKGKRKLVNICEHYGIEFNEAYAHAADYDCLKAAEAAHAMLNGTWTFSNGQPSSDLRELYKQQISWKQEQHDSLKDYFAKQGKTVDGDGLWPVQQIAIDAAAARR